MVAWSTEKCLISDFFLMMVGTEVSKESISETVPTSDLAQFSGSKRNGPFHHQFRRDEGPRRQSRRKSLSGHHGWPEVFHPREWNPSLWDSCSVEGRSLLAVESQR
jgi:hypothetical protein